MKPIQLFIITICIILASIKSNAQSSLFSDTLQIEVIHIHSPNKAALFSTIVPGLGQAYNKKYWKIPIVYAAIGTSLYLGISNQRNFNKYKNAYNIRLDGSANTIDEFDGILTDTGVEANINFYQRNRDLSFIVAGLFYILNIVDAAVDAHLFNFPKNDNLSFNLQPNLELTYNNQITKGVKLVIRL